jgi:hypothetical protein
MRSSLFALAAAVASASAASQGFNYGSTKPDGSFMLQADFQSQFETAKSLVGTSGFTSARLYTMVVSHFQISIRAILTFRSKVVHLLRPRPSRLPSLQAQPFSSACGHQVDRVA